MADVENNHGGLGLGQSEQPQTRLEFMYNKEPTKDVCSNGMIVSGYSFRQDYMLGAPIKPKPEETLAHQLAHTPGALFAGGEKEVNPRDVLHKVRSSLPASQAFIPAFPGYGRPALRNSESRTGGPKARPKEPHQDGSNHPGLSQPDHLPYSRCVAKCSGMQVSCAPSLYFPRN